MAEKLDQFGLPVAKLAGGSQAPATPESVDTSELVRIASTLKGQKATDLRKALVNNQTPAPGLIVASGLAGALPDNPLVKAMVAISNSAIAARKLTDEEATRKATTDKFNKTPQGRMWSSIKASVNTGITLAMAPVEFAGGVINEIAGDVKNEYNAWKKGVDYNNKSFGDIFSGAANQTDLVQYVKQANDYKGNPLNVILNQPDFVVPTLGAGFFPAEDSGAGFAARQVALKSYSIPVMRNGKEIGVRPYGLTTPVTWVLNGGDIESGRAQVMDFVGEFAASFWLDPALAVSKIDKAAKLARGVQTASKGTSSAAKIAKVQQETKTFTEEIQRLNALRDKLLTSSLPNKAGKVTKLEDKIKEAVKTQTSRMDAVGDLVPDYANTAKFLSGDTAAPIIDRLAGMNDVVDIWKATRKITDLPPSFRLALAKATTRDEVLNVFAPFVGAGNVSMGILNAGKKLSPLNTAGSLSHIATKSRQPFVSALAKLVIDSPLGVGAKAIKSTKDKIIDQYSTLIPGGALVNNNDTGLLAEQAYNRLKIGKVPQNVADNLIRRILTSTTSSEAGYTAGARVYNAILKANKSDLPQRLADKLQEASRLYLEGVEETASYWATRHLNGDNLDIITLNGQKLTMTGPHISSELLNSYTYLPPAKEIMDIISRVQRLPAGGAFVKAGDLLISNVWKKSVLIRVPYIVRNIMEEQFRVLLTGHVSFFNQPLSAAAMMLGKDDGPAWRRLIQRHNKVRYTFYGDSFYSPDRIADYADETLAVDAKNSAIHLAAKDDIGAESVRATKSFFIKGGKSVGIGSSRAWEGVSSQIRNLHADPMARKVASTLPGREDETVEFFLNGYGKKDWADFASNKNLPQLLEPDFAKAYLFNSTNSVGKRTDLASRIDELTGGSYALKSLIARGRYLSGGKTFTVPTAKTEALNNVKQASKQGGLKQTRDSNKEFADELKEAFSGTGKWDDSFVVNIPAPIHGRKEELGAFGRFTDGFFDISQSLEKLTTMSPEYQMKYWDAIGDISQSLDAKAMTTLEKTAMQGLRKIISTDAKPVGKNHPVWNAFESSKKSTRPGVLTSDQAHSYAQRVASEHVAELFYNASEKRQLFHMFRLIAPFAQAWGDTINKWSKLGVQNAGQTYKIAKTLDWMQDPKSSSLYNLTDAADYYDPNQGFFFQDPTSGDRQFFVPFLGTVMAKAANALSGASAPGGAPFALTINPASFNFATGTGIILPGFSPGVTWTLAALEKVGVPITKMLPTSMKDALEGYLYPFGKPDVSEGIDALLPGNWTRLFGGILGSEKDFAAAFKPTMAYLASSGDYDPLDPLDQARLTEQTTSFARWFTVMRGFIGLATPIPAALIPIALAKDEDGNATLQFAIMENFQKILESNNYDRPKSYGDVIDLYGPAVMYSIITQGQASSLDTYRLIQKDPSIVSSYADVFGYIFPNGGYSQEMYKWSLKKKGGRYSVDDLKNRALDILRSASTDRLATRAAAEGWSSDRHEQVKKELTDSFGGPTATLMDIGRFERSLVQLTKAVDDPRFANSGAINGAREYMALRDSALADLAPYGLKTMANKASEPLRVWVASQTAKIIDTYPEFGKLFYAVFAKELGYEG